MTAFHTMILFSDGAPLTPAGGSSCSLIDTRKTQVIHNIQISHKAQHMQALRFLSTGSNSKYPSTPPKIYTVYSIYLYTVYISGPCGKSAHFPTAKSSPNDLELDSTMT